MLFFEPPSPCEPVGPVRSTAPPEDCRKATSALNNHPAFWNLFSKVFLLERTPRTCTPGRARRRRSDTESRQDALTVEKHVLIATKCSCTLVHQRRRRGSSDVAAALGPSNPFASTLIPGGNMCAGILPQLRQGLGRSAVGTECGKTEGPTLRPSLTDTQPHSHSLLFMQLPPSCLAHPYCNPSSPTFSPYPLFFLHILIRES